MRDQSIGDGVLRIAGDKLLFVLALEEVEYIRTVAHDFQVGVVHGQLSETENAAAMIDVGPRCKRRLERR